MATSSDVRAIMGIPAPPPPGENVAPGTKLSRQSSASTSKLKKAKRPDGLTRELYALIGDNAPTLSLARPVMKERWKKTPKIVGWEKREFLNKARIDSLKLKHWVKKDQPQDSEYPFAKYNSSSTPFSYSVDEYLHHLRDDDWSREETDYLFDMLRTYDMRFLVVHDRWEFANSNRSIEDLKERYYSVCRQLIRIRPTSDENTRTSLLNAYAFDRNRENARKQYLKSLANRTPEQIAEEEFLYVESRRLEQNYNKIAREREEMLRLVGGPGVTGIPGVIGVGGTAPSGAVGLRGSRRKEDDSDLASGGGKKVKHNSAFDSMHCITRHDQPGSTVTGSRNISAGPSAYLRSARTPHIKPATQAKVEAALTELGINIRLVMPTRSNMEKLEGLINALQMLVDTKKQVDKSEYEVSVLRKRKEADGGAGTGSTTGTVNVTQPEVNTTETQTRTKRSASVSSSHENGANKKSRVS